MKQQSEYVSYIWNWKSALAEMTKCSNLLELGAIDFDNDQFSKASSYWMYPESAESNWELSYKDLLYILECQNFEIISNSSEDHESLSSESKGVK